MTQGLTSQETKSQKIKDGRLNLKDIRSCLTQRQLNRIKRRQKRLRKQRDRGMEMTTQINHMTTTPRSTNQNIKISTKSYKMKNAHVKFENIKHELPPRVLEKIRRKTERLRKEKIKDIGPSEFFPNKECVMESGNMVEKVVAGHCSVGFCRMDGKLHYHKVF